MTSADRALRITGGITVIARSINSWSLLRSVDINEVVDWIFFRLVHSFYYFLMRRSFFLVPHESRRDDFPTKATAIEVIVAFVALWTRFSVRLMKSHLRFVRNGDCLFCNAQRLKIKKNSTLCLFWQTSSLWVTVTLYHQQRLHFILLFHVNISTS